jgi:protein disulfide-isomerase A1
MFYSAKMDATENDIPPSAPFRVNGFPTIKFKPAGSRDFVDYEGDRSLESFVEFIYSKAKNAIPSPMPEAPKETAETSEASPAVTATEAVPQGEKPAQTHVEL